MGRQAGEGAWGWEPCPCFQVGPSLTSQMDLGLGDSLKLLKVSGGAEEAQGVTWAWRGRAQLRVGKGKDIQAEDTG